MPDASWADAGSTPKSRQNAVIPERPSVECLLHVARAVSHIGTPEWQSFELRMRERARVRRAAQRRRRMRRLSAAGVLFVAFVTAAGAYVDVMSEPGPDVRQPARPFAPRGLALPPLPSPILNPVSIDPPMLEENPSAGALLTDPEASRPGTADSTLSPEIEDAPARSNSVEATNRVAAAPAPPMRPATPEPRAEPARPAGTAGRIESSPAAARAPTSAAPPPVSQPAPIVRREPERPDAPARSPMPAQRDAEVAPPVTALPERAPDLPPARNSSTTPSAASAPASPAPAAIDYRARIRGTIESYRRAYESLDASAARAVWPAVEEGALARAFSSLASQRIAFDECSIDVSGRIATASCRGTARVVPRVGGGVQSARRHWVFWLRQFGEDWVIERTQIR
jgi:hypothetical protein